MTDIVQILKDMQQEKDCPMLVHMGLSEAVREIERLRAEIEKLEGTHSPITEEVEDILRSEIAKRDARIAELMETNKLLNLATETIGRSCLRKDKTLGEQAAEISRLKQLEFDWAKANAKATDEISRLKGVLTKCKDAVECALSHDLPYINKCKEALAAVKEIEE